MRHSNRNHKVAESWSSTARTNSLIVIVAMTVMGWFSAKDLGLMFSSDDWQPHKRSLFSQK